MLEESVWSDSKGIEKHIYHYFIPICLEKKKMDTPIKQPGISNMTHEEEEKIQHDVWKSHDQVQQI